MDHIGAKISKLIRLTLVTGWRPRRTIVFCSWGAKEYGLIGSYEWIQQYAEVLSQRVVAYLNVDTAVSGNTSFVKILSLYSQIE